MPELPEIETVKRTLSPLISKSKIIACRAGRPEVIRHPDADSFIRRVIGQGIIDTGRRGKFLLIHLDSGDDMIVHLRMTGRLLCTPPTHQLLPHTHVIFTLSNGQELRFADVRRFGGIWLKAKDEIDDFSGIHRLGIEPLDDSFCWQYLKEKLGKRQVAIKSGILDQHVLAGLGNIYADEVLFAAGVSPMRKSNTLSDKQWQAIAENIPPILREAIANNGTTFSDYLDGAGREGQNMPNLKAYQRAGQPCLNCGEILLKTKVGGRTSCYCTHCQK